MFVDDRVVGILPLAQPLVLLPGSHSMRVELGARKQQDQLKVLAGRLAEMQFNVSSEVVVVTTPYVMFSLIYTLVFVYAFSAIGNFGILVRQRVQVYPVFFVLLALEKPLLNRKSRARTTSAPRRSYVR